MRACRSPCSPPRSCRRSPARRGAVPFPRADANHDGYVTYEEAVRVIPRAPPVYFPKSDPNGDGRISQREYPLLDSWYWS